MAHQNPTHSDARAEQQADTEARQHQRQEAFNKVVRRYLDKPGAAHHAIHTKVISAFSGISNEAIRKGLFFNFGVRIDDNQIKALRAAAAKESGKKKQRPMNDI